MTNKEEFKDIIINDIYKYINEQKRNKKWNIFFKSILLFIIFIFILTALINKNIFLSKPKNFNHIAIIEIDGIISDKNKTNAKNIINSLNEAFYNKFSKAIILRINSPGGSPVQCNIIHNHIKRLRKNNINKPILSVIEDIGTSGAYLIAVSTEKIFSDPNSIIGSIGVTINSFGFTKFIKKLGIERRFYKSGKYKAIMDPFLTVNDEENEIIQNSTDKIHKIFINIVKKNRLNKLKTENDDIFSGKFWIGEEAMKLGLIDGFHDIQSIALDILYIQNIIVYTKNKNIFNSFDKILTN